MLPAWYSGKTRLEELQTMNLHFCVIMSADTGNVYKPLLRFVIDGFGTNGVHTPPESPSKLVSNGVASATGVDDPSYREKNTLELPIEPALKRASLPDW
jgi:hypothetical protein